ncbi:hypothetical protein SAMN05518672_10370 [Chitinophaga sp. CF118]|uniref:hypothetical protein n=1 Tax=Chitinophaga sp. CF118 TaxID=1884367 RepID=UPI0008ECAE16|nr:hypothetical protein [Chitinophaga sp. CF118]SFD75296.1 hypothetical protein SAMN05518672_10370 [Chitinophaga sp. CF118]
MSRNNDEPKILLDSDVIRHFINGNQLLILSRIFPNRFVMLDKVKNELCRSRGIVLQVNNFLSMTKVPVIPFPTDRIIMQEYALLTRQFGEGESACMSVARHQKQFIASSNLKDISAYCRTHGIMYLTTMDILLEAFKKNILTQEECDAFIHDVKSNGSKLPCNTLDEFIASQSNTNLVLSHVAQ